MALKTIVLQRQLNEAQSKLNETNKQLEEFDSCEKAMRDELNMIEEGDTESLNKLIERDEQMENEKKEVIERRDAIMETINELNEKIAHSADGEPVKASGAIKRVAGNNDMVLRDEFNKFLHRAENGIGSTDVTVTIPKDIVYQPQREVSDYVDLKQFVNVVSVSMNSGEYPILKRATAKLSTVEELEKNPELAKPQFEKVDYAVKTYRGAIPIAQEAIDDSAIDLVSLIDEDAQIQELNTTNDSIGTQFKSFTKKECKTLDDIKTILNKDLKAAYPKRFILSQSMFNALDQLKDKDGDYMIQKNITESSDRRLFGYPVSVIPDDMIGESDGSMVGFVGDSKSAITFFDRKQLEAKWVDNEIYGEVLRVGCRFDVKAVDKNAGFYIEWKPAEAIALSADGQVKIKKS